MLGAIRTAHHREESGHNDRSERIAHSLLATGIHRVFKYFSQFIEGFSLLSSGRYPLKLEGIINDSNLHSHFAWLSSVHERITLLTSILIHRPMQSLFRIQSPLPCSASALTRHTEVVMLDPSDNFLLQEA